MHFPYQLVFADVGFRRRAYHNISGWSTARTQKFLCKPAYEMTSKISTPQYFDIGLQTRMHVPICACKGSNVCVVESSRRPLKFEMASNFSSLWIYLLPVRSQVNDASEPFSLFLQSIYIYSLTTQHFLFVFASSLQSQLQGVCWSMVSTALQLFSDKLHYTSSALYCITLVTFNWELVLCRYAMCHWRFRCDAGPTEKHMCFVLLSYAV